MTKLKLGPIQDEKPVKLTIELPAAVHRDLTRYDEALALETHRGPRKARGSHAGAIHRQRSGVRQDSKPQEATCRRAHAALPPTSNAPD